MNNVMRIGIYGGSFNPVHSGHVGIARRAIDELSLDRLMVVPAKESPFKIGVRPLLSDDERLELIRRSFAVLPKCEVSDIELQRGGVSYAVDTVKAVKDANPSANLFFIIGEDSLEGLPRWKNWGELKRLCRFVAFPRTAESSTEIRRRLESGESIAGMVPPEVERFFAERKTSHG
jgi:nicotinate-nucleotide adenylyltransferase